MLSRLQTLREQIIPRVISENKFGSNVRLLNVEADKNYSGEGQYASSVLFVDVIVEDHEQTKHSLVVKYELADEYRRQLMGTELQFYNEVYVYETVLPFLFETCGRSTDEFFPKYYHGVSNYGNNRPEDDIVIVEDLRPKGFRLAEEKLCLDYDHVVVALKKLAEFHSLSYIAKQKQREEFFEKARKPKDVYQVLIEGRSEPSMFVYSVERAFKPLLTKNNEKQNEIMRRFQRRVDDMAQLLADLGTPNEPIAVFCHGDYCRNNVLFKYDEATNKPVDIRFFDLATARYASPVIDLSFFLFLNTTSETRKLHWDVFLNIYYDSLRRSLPRDVAGPTFEQLVEEIQEKGVYGFMHCSYFIPMVIDEDTTNDLRQVNKTTDAESRAKLMTHYGGEKATQLISEMAQEVIDRGFIK